MKKLGPLVQRLLQPRILAVYLFVFCVVFQVLVITKSSLLYQVLKVMFVGLLLLLLAYLVKASMKQKAIVLVILAVVLIRLPFFFHPTGLITMSDNALEALQSQEIQDAASAPFFQFEVLKHQGTLRYTLIAFIWDFFGAHYLTMTLWNLAVFTAILLLLANLLAPFVPKPLILLFSGLSFAFIETMFDSSLLIRGGIYLDALLLALLGLTLFDFEFARKTPVFLSYYFLFFALYIQPIAALFAAAFIFCTLVFSVKQRVFWKNLGLMAAGAALGVSHQVYYYLFFTAKPVNTGAYEKVTLIPLGEVSLRLAGVLARNFKTAFFNLFRYETDYFLGSAPPAKGAGALAALATACLYVSLAVFFAAVVLVLVRVIGRVLKKAGLRRGDWPYLFFLALLAGFLVKLAALQPPRLEPRHSLDLLLLIMMAYFFTFAPLFKAPKLLTLKAAAVALVLLAFTVPHYYFFLKNTVDKEHSYQELMTALRENKVKYLLTDFNIAYPVYFLSRRKIIVSDNIGPLTLSFFYPDLKARVEAAPASEKAFLFYSESAGNRPWHKRVTQRLKARTLDRLKQDKVEFRVIKLKDYVLIVPDKNQPQPVPQGEE
jgi:hypothetical protein